MKIKCLTVANFPAFWRPENEILPEREILDTRVAAFLKTQFDSL
jgi:hypothetical protein